MSSSQRITRLAARMRERADADRLPQDHPMRAAAAQFDEDTRDYFATPQRLTMKEFLDAWRACRRVWCLYTGEPPTM